MRICAPVRHPATPAIARALSTAFSIALLLTPLYANCQAAGTLTPVKLRVHGREVALKTPAVFDGKEVYLPLDALSAFKASYVVTRREETVIVTPSTGASLEIALARPGKELMLPLSALNKQLRLPMEMRAGVCDLDAPAKRAEAPPAVKEPVKEPVRESPKEIRVAAAPVTQKPVNDPPKGSTTVKKAPVPDAPVQTASTVDTQQTSRGSKKPDSTAQKSQGDLQSSQSLEGASTRALLTSAPAQPTSAPKQPGILDDELNLNLPRSGSQDALNPSAKPQYKAPAPTLNIEDVAFEAVDAKHARILIKTSGKANVESRLLRAPTRLSIDFPRTAVSSEQREWMVDHPFASAMHLVQGEKPGSSRLVLDLAELIGYSVEEPTADGVIVNLMVPRGVGKRMQGLRVVIDAGHGGPDSTGCSAVFNGKWIYEKNLTLAMAKQLQRMLTECGVDVIMTRTSDADVKLESRPVVANRNGADLFVSIHVDDCGIPNSASGTTAYYHMDDASSRALAHSIAENVGKVSGLPVRGAWSDRKRFPGSGMAVLRGSRVPSTLVEVGYINNSRDRAKLVDPEFHQTVARAILDGIKGYLKADLPDAPYEDTDTK